MLKYKLEIGIEWNSNSQFIPSSNGISNVTVVLEVCKLIYKLSVNSFTLPSPILVRHTDKFAKQCHDNKLIIKIAK